jgi:hypothetical protein
MLTRLIEDARASGVDATFDSYPYLRGATILAMAALPPEVQAGGIAPTLARLADHKVRKELSRHWFPSVVNRLSDNTLSFVADSGLSWAEGMSLSDAAARADCEVGEFICELLLQSKLAVGCVRGKRPTNGEEESALCCGMTRRWAVLMESSSEACLIPEDGARSHAFSGVMSANSATGPSVCAGEKLW